MPADNRPVVAHQCETSVFGAQAKWHLMNEANVVVFVAEIVAVVVCTPAALVHDPLSPNVGVIVGVIVALVV